MKEHQRSLAQQTSNTTHFVLFSDEKNSQFSISTLQPSKYMLSFKHNSFKWKIVAIWHNALQMLQNQSGKMADK